MARLAETTESMSGASSSAMPAGSAVDSADQFVTLNIPDEDKILEGQGENSVARVVIYDNKAARASGYDEKSVITLKAQKKPVNLPLILGAAGGGIVM